MNILIFLVICTASGAYVILIAQTLKKNQREEDKASFSSFLLWLILDVILLVNTLRAKNDLTLITTYTILTAFLVFALFYKKQYAWKRTDTFVAFLAFACLVTSYLTTPIAGVTFGALSIGCAGIPNLIKLSKTTPNGLGYLTIFFFFIAPVLSTINFLLEGASFKEFIYPGIAIIYWSTAFLLAQASKINNTQQSFN